MINDNDPLLTAIADSFRFLGPGDFMIAFPQVVDNPLPFAPFARL
jgi:hypothetical protein